MRTKQLFLLLFSCLILLSRAQNDDTLYVNYVGESPYAYSENGTLKGIEIEMMDAYISWLKNKKKVYPYIKHQAFRNFDDLNAALKKATKNTFGLGSFAISAEKAKDVDFTTPVLKVVAVCITNGNAPDAKSGNREEIVKVIGNMTALTIQGTTLEKYCNELRKNLPELKINFQPSEAKILEDISKNVLQFGYVDAITFWFYLKSNPRKFLKMQRHFNQSKEDIGFVLPKFSPYKASFNEFFSGPGGFKTSKAYMDILEKYLGSFMAFNVAEK